VQRTRRGGRLIQRVASLAPTYERDQSCRDETEGSSKVIELVSLVGYRISRKGGLKGEAVISPRPVTVCFVADSSPQSAFQPELEVVDLADLADLADLCRTTTSIGNSREAYNPCEAGSHPRM